MRGIFAAVCVFAVATGMAAQDSAYVIKLGASLAFFGAGMNTDAAEGRKTRVDFYALPAFGIVIYAPFGTGIQMGGRLDIGISSLGTRTRPYEFYDGKSNWEGYFKERYQYFTIAPSVNLAGILIGAGFNFPMSGQMWHPDRSSEKFDVDKSTMKSLTIDVRIGSMINVWKTTFGTLFVEAQVKYFVMGLYKEGKYTMGNTVGPNGDPSQDFRTYKMLDNVPGAAQIGVSYLFDLSL